MQLTNVSGNSNTLTISGNTIVDTTDKLKITNICFDTIKIDSNTADISLTNLSSNGSIDISKNNGDIYISGNINNIPTAKTSLTDITGDVSLSNISGTTNSLLNIDGGVSLSNISGTTNSLSNITGYVSLSNISGNQLTMSNILYYGDNLQGLSIWDFNVNQISLTSVSGNLTINNYNKTIEKHNCKLKKLFATTNNASYININTALSAATVSIDETYDISNDKTYRYNRYGSYITFDIFGKGTNINKIHTNGQLILTLNAENQSTNTTLTKISNRGGKLTINTNNSYTTTPASGTILYTIDNIQTDSALQLKCGYTKIKNITFLSSTIQGLPSYLPLTFNNITEIETLTTMPKLELRGLLLNVQHEITTPGYLLWTGWDSTHQIYEGNNITYAIVYTGNVPFKSSSIFTSKVKITKNLILKAGTIITDVQNIAGYNGNIIILNDITGNLADALLEISSTQYRKKLDIADANNINIPTDNREGYYDGKYYYFKNWMPYKMNISWEQYEKFFNLK